MMFSKGHWVHRKSISSIPDSVFEVASKDKLLNGWLYIMSEQGDVNLDLELIKRITSFDRNYLGVYRTEGGKRYSSLWINKSFYRGDLFFPLLQQDDLCHDDFVNRMQTTLNINVIDLNDGHVEVVNDISLRDVGNNKKWSVLELGSIVVLFLIFLAGIAYLLGFLDEIVLI